MCLWWCVYIYYSDVFIVFVFWNNGISFPIVKPWAMRCKLSNLHKAKTKERSGARTWITLGWLPQFILNSNFCVCSNAKRLYEVNGLLYFIWQKSWHETSIVNNTVKTAFFKTMEDSVSEPQKWNLSLGSMLPDPSRVWCSFASVKNIF